MLVQRVAARTCEVAALRDVQVRRKHARLGNDPLEEAAARKMFQQRRIHRGHIVLGNILLEHARANRSALLGQTDRISGTEQPTMGFLRSRTELPLR